MSSSKQNRAAWQRKMGAPLEIDAAPYPTIKPNQIIIRSRAVAVNPWDRLLQETGPRFFSWMKLPTILGSDVAGEVVEVGSLTTRFKPGDRVVGMALGVTNGKVDSTQGAYQEMVVMREDLCAAIPKNVSYESASVLPLGLSTAACGLYQKDYLNLAYPTMGSKSMGKTVLIWGGSTSVGLNAVQLAKASGYEVITTCSPRNVQLVKKMGASQVFDYNSPTVVDEIVNAFQGKSCAGVLSVGNGSVEKCLDIMAQLHDTNKTLAMATLAFQPANPPSGFLEIVSFLFSMASANLKVWLKCRRHGLKTNFIFASDLEANDVGPAVWKDFLGDALLRGSYVPSPEPLIESTKGLEGIQEGFRTQKNETIGTKKIVVSL